MHWCLIIDPFPKPVYIYIEFYIAKYMMDWDFENSVDYKVKIPHHRRQGCSTPKETPCSANE